MMDCQKIGNFIAELRKENNMTQKDIAEKLNITDRAVSKWERGLGCPDITLVVELSKILNVSVNEILAGEKIPNMSKEHADRITTESIKKYHKETQREFIKKMLVSIPLFFIVGTLLILFIGQMTRSRIPSFTTISNVYYSDKLYDAIENYDYNVVSELIFPQSSLPRRYNSKQYMERLKELEGLGVKFLNHQYTQCWFDGSNFAVEYLLKMEYKGEKTELWVQTTTLNGKITGIRYMYEMGKEFENAESWNKILEAFKY